MKINVDHSGIRKKVFRASLRIIYRFNPFPIVDGVFFAQYFQLYSISMSSFREIFHIIVEMISKSSAADLLLYVGKG